MNRQKFFSRRIYKKKRKRMNIFIGKENLEYRWFEILGLPTQKFPSFFFSLKSRFRDGSRLFEQSMRRGIVSRGFSRASPLLSCGKTELVSVINILRKPIPLFLLASILWYRVICHIDQSPGEGGSLHPVVSNRNRITSRFVGAIMAALSRRIWLKYFYSLLFARELIVR